MPWGSSLVKGWDNTGSLPNINHLLQDFAQTGNLQMEERELLSYYLLEIQNSKFFFQYAVPLYYVLNKVLVFIIWKGGFQYLLT